MHDTDIKSILRVITRAVSSLGFKEGINHITAHSKMHSAFVSTAKAAEDCGIDGISNSATAWP